MKNLKSIVPVSLLSILITSCGNINEDSPSSYVESPIQEQPVEVDNTSNYIFELTEEEVQIYELLKEELSTSVFESVDPFSIAKIHIQAGLDGEWQAEYIMFSSIGREKSLEEWEMLYKYEKSKDENFKNNLRIMANETFALLEEGTFVKDNETEAHILFENIFGDKMTFRFIKNEAGIWEVKFAPIQFV